MGIGLVMIVDADAVDDVRAAAESAGDTTYIIGKIDDGEGVVRYNNSGHLFDEKDWSAR